MRFVESMSIRCKSDKNKKKPLKDTKIFRGLFFKLMRIEFISSSYFHTVKESRNCCYGKVKLHLVNRQSFLQ